MEQKITLIQADITTLQVDAIVNAANNSLLGGGGVDGAIHRAAGKQLVEECQTLGGCKTGEAAITNAYNLPSQKVIHAVGPVWRAGTRNEPKYLKSAYEFSLQLCEDNGLKSVAFPNISTGIYGYPKDKAAKIAISTVKEFLKKSEVIEEVIFCCFDDENYSIYDKILNGK